MTEHVTFGDVWDGALYLRRKIVDSGRTQYDIANMLGVSDAKVFYILAGKKLPTASTLIKICNFIGLNIKELQDNSEYAKYAIDAYLSGDNTLLNKYLGKKDNKADKLNDCGKYIKTVLASRSLTQRDLSQAANMTEVRVSQVFTGKAIPHVEELYRIAGVLAIDINEWAKNSEFISERLRSIQDRIDEDWDRDEWNRYIHSK